MNSIVHLCSLIQFQCLSTSTYTCASSLLLPAIVAFSSAWDTWCSFWKHQPGCQMFRTTAAIATGTLSRPMKRPCARKIGLSAQPAEYVSLNTGAAEGLHIPPASSATRYVHRIKMPKYATHSATTKSLNRRDWRSLRVSGLR